MPLVAGVLFALIALAISWLRHVGRRLGAVERDLHIHWTLEFDWDRTMRSARSAGCSTLVIDTGRHWGIELTLREPEPPDDEILATEAPGRVDMTCDPSRVVD